MDKLAKSSRFGTIVLHLSLIFLFSLIYTVKAGPAGFRKVQSCATHCVLSNDPVKFMYETGTIYEYEFITQLETLVLEETSQKSKLQISSKVEIQAFSSCDFNVQLKDVQVIEPLAEGSTPINLKHISQALEKHSLQFAFQDGQIEHLCSHSEEPSWVTNVKRGILSMLQNTMEDWNYEGIVQEVDINGKCGTQYSQSGSSWGGSHIITKFKDLSACTNRRHHLSTIQSVPFASNPETSLLSGTVDCKQTILQNKIEKVECVEEQIFKPFEENSSGARNLITQTLRLLASYPNSNSQKVDAPSLRTSLVFETDALSMEASGDFTNAQKLLKDLETKTIPSVQKDAPSTFRELIESLRALNELALKALLKIEENEPAETILLDAMPFINTAPSLSIMTNLYLNENLDKNVAISWLSSVAFIKHPTPAMISALMPLILEDTPTTEVLLSVSSIMNSYCKQLEDCGKDTLILKALEKISEPLGNSCDIPQDDTEVRRVVVALKALGNIGFYLDNPNNPILEECFTKKSNSIQVRLAAIDAHRRMTCSSFSLSPFLKMYSDYGENTEIRIHSYLVAIKCGNRKVLELVEDVMIKEVVNQVGSFVWTHLTNLQESSRPEKQVIRNLLSNGILQNKFQTDARKFSRNFESSMFSNEYKMGAGVDSNVIFTEESFLPKSLMANFSIQFLGETVNLFEVGGRFTNPESLLEPLFGPEGYFPDESMTSFIQSKRQKRDTKNIARLATVYEAATNSEPEKIPGGSLYARLFGHEVLYKEFEVNTDSTIPNVVDENGRKWLSIKTLMDNLSTGKKTDFTHSAILMDIDYAVPTISGIPLILSLQTGSTVGLSAEGKFNVGKFIEKRGLEIYGLLRPNFAVSVDASLTMKLGPTNNFLRSGLSVRNVIRSSTAIEAQVEVNEAQALKASFNLPQARQDILEASSKVVFIKPSGGIQILDITYNNGAPTTIQNSTCFGDKSSNWLGLKICGEISTPEHFTVTPLTPAVASLYVEKTDDFYGYNVEYSLERKASKTRLDLVFDTPGSQVNRRTSLNLSINPGGSFTAALNTPTIVLDANGALTNNLKSLEITITDSGEQLLQLNTSLTTKGNKITPNFFLALFKKPITDLRGTIQLPTVEGNTKTATVDVTLKYVTESPIRLQGKHTTYDENSEVSLGIESYFVTGKLVSNIKNRSGHWSSRSVLEYSWKHGEINNVDISAKLQRSRKGSLSKFATAASFVMSKYPDHSLDFSWETVTSLGFCENVAKLSIGKSSWDAHTLYSLQNNRDLTELRVLLSVNNPRKEIDYHLEFSHRMIMQSINTKFIGRTSTMNEMTAKFQYDALSKPFTHNNISAEITWPGSQYTFESALIEKRKGEFDGEVLINLNNFKEMKATISYINNSNNLKLDHLVEFRVRGFFSVPVSGNIGFSVTDKQSHIGCQILIEGKKPYSSRLSTSVDYSHIRNTHKIEGKVTFNEKKYSSEIIFGKTKSGSKHLTLDLFLNQHIFLEGKMAGAFPEAVTASVTIIANKDHRPNDKMELKGLLSSNNVELYGHYFGENVGIQGKLDAHSMTGDLSWGDAKKISASAKLSPVNLASGYLSLELLTPFEEFRNMSLIWNHEAKSDKLAAKLVGNIDEKSFNFEFLTAIAPRDINLKIVLDLPGYSRRAGNAIISRSAIKNTVRALIEIGDRKGLFYLDNTQGTGFEVHFEGMESSPQLHLLWNHEQVDKHHGHFQFEWGLSNLLSKKIRFEFEKNLRPLSYNFSAMTPWSIWRSTTGFIKLDQPSTGYILQVTNDANLFAIPKSVLIMMRGTLAKFEHNLSIKSQNGDFEMLLSGHCNNINDVDIVMKLKTRRHNYNINIKSELKNETRKLEVFTEFDNKKSVVGVVLKNEGEFGKNEITAWGTYLSGPEKKATILLEKDQQMRKFVFSVSDNSKPLIQLETYVVWSGFKFWSLTLELKSTFGILPSISFESSHNMLDPLKILNSNTLILSPIGESFWEGWVSTRNLSSQLVITDLKSIYGSINWDSDDLTIAGDISDGVIHFDILSSIFLPINGNVDFDLSQEKFLVHALTHRSGERILDARISSTKTSDKIDFSGSLTSTLLPTLESKLVADRNTGIAETFLKSDGNYIFHVNFIGKMSSTEGIMKVQSKSHVFPSINNILMDTMFKLGEEEKRINFHAKYENRDDLYHIKGFGSWGDEKAAKITSQGNIKAELEIKMKSSNKVVAIVSYESYKLGMLEVSYDNKPSSYAWGHHIVGIRLTNGEGESSEMTVSVLADTFKFDVEVTTPFTSWTKMRLYADVDFQSISKAAKFGIHKDQDKLDCSFDFKSFKRNETTIVGTEISIQGFQTLRGVLLEKEGVKEQFRSLSRVEGKFTALAKWSKSNAELIISTPIERWRNLKFAGDFETKKNIKTLAISCDINERHHEFKGSAKIGKDKLEIDFTTQCLKTYKGKFDLNYSNDYKLGVKLDGMEVSWKMDGTLSQTGFLMEATTPLKNYERLRLQGNYNYVSNSQHDGNVLWRINGVNKEAGYTFQQDERVLSIGLKTPLENWETVKVNLDYDDLVHNINFKLERNDGQKVLVGVRTKIIGEISNISSNAQLQINLKVESPFQQYRKMLMTLDYNRTGGEHTSNIEYSRNEQLLKLNGHFSYNDGEPHAVEIQVDLSSLQNYSSKVQATLSVDPTGNSSFAAVVEFNEAKHEVNAAMDLSPDSKVFSLKTTLPFLRTVKLHLKTGEEVGVRGLWEGEDQLLDVQANLLTASGWDNQRLNLSVISPFDGLKHIFLEVDSKLTPNALISSVIFENEYSRWLGKLSGSVDEELNGEWIAQINTPIKDYHDISLKAKHSWSPQLKAISCSIDKSSSKFMDLNASLRENRMIQLRFDSAMFDHQLSAHSSIQWGTSDFPINFQTSISSGEEESKTNFEVNIQGLSSGMVNFRSLAYPEASTKIAWKLDGTLEDGNAWSSLNNQLMGSKSLRGSWKGRTWKQVRTEIWLRVNEDPVEKGGMLQYSLVPVMNEGHKLNIQGTWTMDKTTPDTFSTVIKATQQSRNYIVEIEGESTLKQFKKIQTSISLQLGSEELNFHLDAKQNDEQISKIHSTIFLSPSKSKFSLDMDVSGVGRPLQVLAAYDTSADKKPLELLFKQANYLIRLQTYLKIPSNRKEIEFNFNMSSNVSSMKIAADGLLKGSYQFHSNGMSQLTLTMESEKIGDWNLVAAVRPTTSDFYLNIELNSTTPDSIPPLFFKLNWRGSYLQSVSSSVALKFKDVLTLNGNFSLSQDSVRLSVSTPLECCKETHLEGFFHLGQELNDFQFKLQAFKEEYHVKGNYNISKDTGREGVGSIWVWKGAEKDRLASLQLKYDGTGHLGAVGIWGQRKMQVKAALVPVGPFLWIESGKTNFAIFIDDVETIVVESIHTFKENEYLLNLTSGTNKAFKLHVLLKDPKMVVSSSLQWDSNNKMKFLTELHANKFDTFFSSPWTADVAAHGMFEHDASQTLIDAFLIYDMQKSTARLESVNRNESGTFNLSLDIPPMHQKLFTTLLVQSVPSAGQSAGKLDVRVNDRHFGLTGEINSRIIESQAESKVSISLTIPTKQVQKLTTQITIRKPLNNFNSLVLNASLAVGSESVQLSFGYDVPSTRNDIGVTFFLQNSFDSPFSYGFNTKFTSWTDARISLIWFSNNVDLVWRLKLSDLELSLKLAPSHPEHMVMNMNNYQFELKGFFDPSSSRGINISLDTACKNRRTNAHFLAHFEAGGISGEVMISSTEHIYLNHVYRIKIKNQESGKYSLEFSGLHDTLSTDIIGDLSIGREEKALNGKMFGSFGTIYAHLNYSKGSEGSHQVHLSLESPSLIAGKKVIIKGDLLPRGTNGFEANLQCRTRSGMHSSSLKIVPTPLQGNIGFSLDTPQTQPVVIELNWKKDGPQLNANCKANFDNIVNELEAFLDVLNLEGRVKIISPMIPSSHFEVHLKSLLNSDEIDILGDVHIREYRWRFEGALKYNNWRDMVAMFNLLTPHKSFDRLTLAVKSSGDEIYGEIYTPITAIPNAMFKITGFEAIQKGEWHDLHPGISIGLPLGKYSAFCIYKTPTASNSGKLRIFIENGSISPPAIYEISTEISALSSFNFNMNEMSRVFLSMTTPIKELPNVEFELQGKVRGRSVIQLVTNGKLNQDKVSFTFDYDHDNGNPTISSKLTSPFELYENVAFSLSFDSFNKIGNGRSLHMIVENPDWMDRVTLDADYRYQYNGFLKMEGEMNAALVSFMDIPPVHLHLKTETESGFSGIISGYFGRDNPGTLKMDVIMGDEDMAFILNGTAGQDDNLYTFFVKSNLLREASSSIQMATEISVQDFNILSTHATFSSVLDIAGGDLKLYTPWGPLELSLTLIPILPLMGNEIEIERLVRNSNATFNFHFEEKRIIGFQFVSSDGVGVVELFNPISPISLMLSFKRYTKSSLDLIAELCWDIEEPVGNTVGAGLTWNRGMLGNQLGLTLNLEQAGYLDTQLFHSLTSSKFNQTAMIKWDSPLFDTIGQSGYQILVSKDSTLRHNNYNATVQVDMPWRSIVLDMLSHNNAEDSLQSFVWRWDATRDESKFISAKWQQNVKSAWRVTQLSNFFEFSHPLADQPIIATFEGTYKNSKFQKIQFQLKVDENPQNALEFFISRNDSNLKANVQHIPTNFYMGIITHTSQDKFSTVVSYMDSSGLIRNLTLETTSKQNVHELVIFSKKMEHKSDILIFKSHFYPDLATINCRLLSYDADIILQTSLPFLELLVKHKGEDKFKVFGGYSHKKKVGAHMGRIEGEAFMPFFMVNAELTDTNAFITKANWSPSLFSDLLNLEIPRSISSSLWSDIYDTGVLQGVTNEVGERWEQISPEFQSILKQIGNLLMEETTLCYEELRKVVKSLVQLYETNTFYIKDILGNFGGVGVWFKSIINIIQEGWTDLITMSSKFASETCQSLSQLYQSYDYRLENLVLDYWTQAENVLRNLWHENVQFVSSLFDKVMNASEFLLNALEGKIEEIERKLMAVGFFRKLIQVYKEYATWIDELPIQEFTKKIEEMMNIKFWDRLKSLFAPLFEAIRSGVEDEYFKELLDTPPLPFLRYGISTLQQALIKFWDVLEVEQRLKSLCRAGLRNIDTLMHRYLPTATFDYDIDLGFAEYNQSLSAIQWSDFTQLPRWRTAAEEVQDVSQMTNFYYKALDTIENLKPVFDLNIRSFLPPFGSYALMAGDYHYFTFDNRYFRFAGECSYLLVADLSHSSDTFSLVVNYENKGGIVRKKSYSITVNGSVVDIEISDFKTTIHGKKVELPLNIGSLFIRRHQSGLEIYDKRGFTMTCSISSSVCTVGVSGWHFGKLAGLLGTYDNEPINDMQSPDRKLISDASAFAYSWRVGKNSGICRMKNFAKDEEGLEDIDEICHNLLRNRSSPLRPCFNTVDSQVFMEMCKYDVSRNVNSANREEAACPSMNAYVTECQKNNVDVWMPPTCVRCKLEDGTALTTGENATFQVNSKVDGERQPPSSSDNVILIEELSSIPSSTLAEAIKRLDLALNAEGIVDNRYAIIGYGGEGSFELPHIKTTAAKVWAHNTLIKIPNDTTTIHSSKSAGLYDAIEYAAKLGFRAGVAKNFIAVTEGGEDCGDPTRYADTLTLLVENDIKLHLLVPKQFTLKGNPKDELNQIYGMDMAGVYTWKHAKSGTLEPDVALKRQINLPKDFCTPLAMESNGTRFNAEQPSKKVLDLWSRRIAQTSHPSACQRCECVPDKFGSASIMCHQCLSPSLWKFMEEWKSYQVLDGEEFMPPELFEQGDYIMSS